jgi:hypothetical protein
MMSSQYSQLNSGDYLPREASFENYDVAVLLFIVTAVPC